MEGRPIRSHIVAVSASSLCAVLLWPQVAKADAGLPMLAYMLPFMIIAIVPIIGAESYVLWRYVQTSYLRSVYLAGAANLASTFLGVPLAWAALVLVEFLCGGGSSGVVTIGPFESRLLTFIRSIPFQDPDVKGWQVQVSVLVLLIPFFYVSYWVEFWVIRLLDRRANRTMLAKAVWVANLTTYLALGLITSCFFVYFFLLDI